MPISDAIRQAVRERAKYLCEYCHSPERLSANRFTVDHVREHVRESTREAGEG
jgi:5-methylcytosine-specific restriction endonuclease McrA